MKNIAFHKKWTVIKVKNTLSTMDEVKKLEYKTYEPLAIYAEKQKEGRGRRENKWISNKGNLFLSLKLKKISINKPFMLNYLTSIVVYECLLNYLSHKKIYIKWPNDILVRNKKIAGILAEMTNVSGQLENVIIGIGVNIKNAPNNLKNYTTFLEKESRIKKIDLESFIYSLLDKFSYWERLTAKNGFKKLIEEWMKRSVKKNTIIKFNDNNNLVKGLYNGINNDGSISIIINNKVKKFFNISLEI